MVDELRVYTCGDDTYAQVNVATVGQNIKALREAAGYKTQGAFAEKLGIPQPRLNDWENSRYKTIALTNLLLVAKTLRVSVDDLLRGVDLDYDRVCHGGDQELPSTNRTVGGADDPSHRARIRELEQELASFKARWRDVQDVARSLFRIAVGDEGGAAGGGKTGRGRTARKTG